MQGKGRTASDVGQGEGVSDVWVKGREGGMYRECAIWCIERGT